VSKLILICHPASMFASPVTNTYETLYQQALDREMLASLDSGWDLCCCFEGYFVPSGVKQLWVWWAVPTRHFADASIPSAEYRDVPTDQDEDDNGRQVTVPEQRVAQADYRVRIWVYSGLFGR